MTRKQFIDWIQHLGLVLKANTDHKPRRSISVKCHRSRVFFGNLDCDIAHFKQDTNKVFDDLLTATWSFTRKVWITSLVTLKHSTETPEQAIMLTTTSNGDHARMSSISFPKAIKIYRISDSRFYSSTKLSFYVATRWTTNIYKKTPPLRSYS